MKTILLMSLILTLGMANLGHAKSKNTKALDCKGGDLILPECQIDDIKTQIESDPLFAATKAEALIRLENTYDNVVEFVKKPHCFPAKTTFNEKSVSGGIELTTLLKCETSYYYTDYSSTPELKPSKSLVTRSLTVSLRIWLENEYEMYYARIQNISFSDQSWN